MEQIRISELNDGVYVFSISCLVSFNSRLNIGLMSYCQATYYGNQCSVRCISNDDCTSSYICDSVTGAKVCSPGWYGNDCEIRNTSYIQAICSSTSKIN